ncbi:MAG: argininosuccinate lyase [Deltaproteobacteria bacterium]|nr:argininosuccinate lyase [Deltaproteobacteria bacterium]
MPLWSGRFEGTMSDAMRGLNTSLAVDIRLLPYDLQVNRVWAQELQRIGVLAKQECEAIDKGLSIIAEEWRTIPARGGPEAGLWGGGASRRLGEGVSPSRGSRPAQGATPEGDCAMDEDVHSLVERRLTECCGPAGAKIHTGRSRNDQVMTDLRLYLKDVITQLRHSVRGCVAAVCDHADRHTKTIMPGYTHLQQAQPIALAHYLLSLAASLKEDDGRLADALARLDACPLGSGAIAGSAYPIDRERVAKALGFARATTNSIAAVSMRDECLEVASACSILMTHLSRYAEDFILWSTREFGFVTFADAVTTGSSMMPQKKNPDAMELIRGKTARVIGQMQTLFTLVKGLPLAYARDLQEDKPALFDLLDQTALCLAVFTEAIAGASFHADRMRAALDANLYATELADYLVKKGLPFREAHGIVGTLVRTALETRCNLRDLPLTELKKASPLFSENVMTCFDPAAALARRNLIGGTGPESVAQQLTTCRAWLR